MYYGMSMTKSFVLYLVTYVGRIFGAHVTLQVRMPLLPLADHRCLSSTRRDPENQFLDESRSSNFFLRRGGRPSMTMSMTFCVSNLTAATGWTMIIWKFWQLHFVELERYMQNPRVFLDLLFIFCMLIFQIISSYLLVIYITI